MMNLFKAFTTGDVFNYEGAMIAKAKYQNFGPASGTKRYKNEIVKSNKRLSIINCNGYIENKVVETLFIYLIMDATIKGRGQKEIVSEDNKIWHIFSKDEIRSFSEQTGDINSIHLSDNPIVQGLLILKEIYNTVQTQLVEVKYCYPIFGEKPVYLKYENNKIKGISENTLCFEVII